jgi:hypothetical protein
MIANGVAADATDEYVCVRESTALECLRKLVVVVVEVFGPEYLRLSNEHDTARLLAIGESRGFLGMVGSNDCMYWGWKNYSIAWFGIYRDHKKETTIILEAVLQKTYGFDMYFLGCSAHTISSSFLLLSSSRTILLYCYFIMLLCVTKVIIIL